MIVAASTRSFAEMDFWQALDNITDLEFDRVEIWLDENGSLKPSYLVDNSEDFIAKIRDRTRLSPIAITFAHDVDESVFLAVCRIAKSLRISQIVVPSSPLGTPFNQEIDRLKALVSVGTAHGVRIGLKTQAGRLSGDAHTAVELCQAVDKLGLAFDPSYFLDPKIVDSVMELVAPYTLHANLRDSTASQLQVQIGLGEVDYGKLIGLLEKHRYNRALSIELIPEFTEPEHRSLELRKLRRLLESSL